MGRRIVYETPCEVPLHPADQVVMFGMFAFRNGSEGVVFQDR